MGEDNGARLRVRHLLIQLSKFADTKLVFAGLYGDGAVGAVHPDSCPWVSSEVFEFHSWKISGWRNRLRHEFGSDYLNTNRLRVTDKDRTQLMQLIEEHDLVWVHGLRVANGFDLWKWPKSILDIDDIPSEWNRSRMVQARSPVEKLRAFRQVCMWRRHESRIIERFRALVVCSEPDRSYFGSPECAFVVPNGFNEPCGQFLRNPLCPARIGFIGSLEYAPNERGLRWFLNNVWLRIIEKNPEVILRLVGRNSNNPEWLSYPGVQGLGWVENADDEMSTWNFTIVPVFEGGGTRVKISNAFSRRCPVVSTSLGAYGYNVSNEKELLIADTSDDFTLCCLRMLDEKEFADQLAENAWNAFLENWTWDAIGKRLEEAVRYVTAMGAMERQLVKTCQR